MVNSPKSEVIEGGGKLARALNDKGVEVTFGKRSEGNDDLSTVIDMAANQINSSSGDITIEIGTFTDLYTLITNTTTSSGQIPIIILDKDYQYDSTTDSSLTNGIEITKDIIIIGNGHIIDGNNTKRAFYIYGQHTVNLYDLRIQNCNENYGGAIYVMNATININNTQFTNNTSSETYGDGGAIHIENNATVNITNSTFNKNNADYGGAIYATSSATININNTQFTNNTATSGGAIYSWSGVTLNIRNSSFTDNTANSYANIYSNSEISVYDCIISNIATSCYNVTNIPYLATTIVDNLTTDDATKVLSAKQGKVLQDGKQATLVSGTNIKTVNNESLLGSGNITISGNVGTFSDLADLMADNPFGTITLTKDYVNTDNYNVDGILIPRSTNMIIDGGGHVINAEGASKFFRFIPDNNYIDINIIFKNIIFRCAVSDSEMGGDYYGTGGGFYSKGATLTFDNCIFEDNEADIGGVIYLEKDTNLNIFNCYFVNNESYGNGSVIYQQYYSTNVININNSVFDDNFASDEGTIYLNNTNVKIKDCVFKNNRADTYKDIYNNSNSNLNIYNCDINGSTTCYNVTNKPYLTDHQDITGKQATLVSGTNIKTVNNESLLGSGNITISGGSNIDIVTSWESTLSDSKVPSEKLTKDTIDTKINTSDIVDNLTTNNATKVLSAKQGKVLYDMIVGIENDMLS